MGAVVDDIGQCAPPPQRGLVPLLGPSLTSLRPCTHVPVSKYKVKILPVFITCDPARDDTKSVKTYVKGERAAHSFLHPSPPQPAYLPFPLSTMPRRLPPRPGRPHRHLRRHQKVLQGLVSQTTARPRSIPPLVSNAALTLSQPGLLLHTAQRDRCRRLPGGPLHLLLPNGPQRRVRRRVWPEHGPRGDGCQGGQVHLRLDQGG